MLDNTIIVFSSDNGGATSALFATGARSPEEREESGGVELGAKPPASNGNFRGGKGSLHEGGVRVPTIVNWPAKLKPAVVNEPLHMVDVMPTLLALAGAKGSRRSSLRRQGHVADAGGGKAVAERGHPDQRRAVPRRHPQGQLEARPDRPAARQDWSCSTWRRTPARRTTSPMPIPRSSRICRRACCATRRSRSRASGSRRSRRSWEHKARPSSIPTSTSTTADCRMRSRSFPKMKPSKEET